jgi:lactobin A/cerein 7B family class IIb bacteriocin
MDKYDIMRELNACEIENINGGIAPVLVALAWGFGIGFPSGVAIGIAKNV